MDLVFLPDDPEGDATLLGLDGDGRVLARRVLHAQAGPSAAAIRARVVVPGTRVHALWRSLPARQHAHALAAARLALEDHVAGDLATLHVVVEAAGDPSVPRCILAVAHATLQAWLAQCDRLGVVPEAMVPDFMLLPPPDDGDALRVAAWQGDMLVRGHARAFRIEPALLEVVADAQALRPVEPDIPVETLFARHAASAAPDLLQGAYARRDGRQARRRRRLLLLAALVLASPALVDGGVALRHAVAAHSLQSRAEAILASRHPEWVAGTDPASAATALVSGAIWPDMQAWLLDKLAEAVSAVPGSRLDALSLARGGPAQVGVQHRDAATLDALRVHLADQGLDVRVLDTQPLGDGWRSELSIEVPR